MKRLILSHSQEVRNTDMAELLTNISHTTHQVYFKNSIHLHAPTVARKVAKTFMARKVA
jgi:hypothetical protein